MAARSLSFIVDRGGRRIDRLVADATGEGRRTVRALLAAGLVRIDGRTARRGSDPATQGSEIVVDFDLHPEPSPPPAAALEIVLETPRLLVVAKPAGLHSESGRSPQSLAGLLVARFSELAAVGDRPSEAGLVHRLDRDTSGAVLVATRREEYRRLRHAFRSGAVRKHYLALACGRLEAAVEVDVALARRRGSMAPASRHEISAGQALPAITRLEPLENGSDWTLVLATMRSGVMHQVRAHLAAGGHPICGDFLYGGVELAVPTRAGQLLHALRITVADELDVTVAPPGDFLLALARLRRRAG